MKKYSRIGCITVAIIFVLYAGMYVYRSSFVLADGNRYFCLFDDAMVSMRYAWNFSHGLGLVWNAGERIEGYTNPLMVAVMSAATGTFDKSTSCLAVQIFGIAVLLGSAVFCTRIITQLMTDDLRKADTNVHGTKELLASTAVILGFCAPLLYYPLIRWSLRGMETGLLTLIFLAITYFIFKHDKTLTIRGCLVIGLLASLAYLARPDSVISVGVLLAYLFARHTYSCGVLKTVRPMSAIGLILVTIIAAHLSFRWSYYGHLLPNTYVLKATGLTRWQYARDGFIFLRPFFSWHNWGLFILILTACFYSRSPKRLAILAAFCSLIAYQIYIGGDPWQYWRILCPAIPLLFLVVILEIMRLVLAARDSAYLQKHFLNNQKPTAGLCLTFMTGLFLLVVLCANRRFLPEAATVRPDAAMKFATRHSQMGITLSQITRPQATVGVFWAGAIPYYSGRYSIDFLGKCDEVISHLPADTSGGASWWGMLSLPGHNKYDLDYSIKKLKPDYVQEFEWGTQSLSDWKDWHYVSMLLDGVTIYLKKDSPNIRWDKIAAKNKN